ncbi:hypothetical protein [Ruminococcus flavefaciens]|uniref:hypothetical protein n=1 Tax=Ruminococcus flavefaciens TaxID=1265 RepID=UPI0003626AB8|nr:hypothetical protein [Ruminococcus flavefaciens]
MKKTAYCLALLAMMAATVSCGKTSADTSEPENPLNSVTTAASGNTDTAQTTKVTVNEKKAARTTANNDKHGQLELTSDINEIKGFWVEENVLDPRTINIMEDGSFELKYKGGGSMTGTVRKITEVYPDGNVVYYQFCDADGEFWEYFFKDITDTTQDRITAGQGEDMLCFIRSKDNTSPAGNDTPANNVSREPAPSIPEAKDIRDALAFADALACGGGIKTDMDSEYRTDDGTIYHKSTDNIYTSTADVREYLTRYMTDTFISSSYEHLLGTDHPKCIDVNGRLYIEYRPMGGRYSFTYEDPEITVSSAYPEGYSINIKNDDYGAEVIVTVDVIKDNGSWKITGVNDSF